MGRELKMVSKGELMEFMVPPMLERGVLWTAGEVSLDFRVV